MLLSKYCFETEIYKSLTVEKSSIVSHCVSHIQIYGTHLLDQSHSIPVLYELVIAHCLMIIVQYLMKIEKYVIERSIWEQVI